MIVALEWLIVRLRQAWPHLGFRVSVVVYAGAMVCLVLSMFDIGGDVTETLSWLLSVVSIVFLFGWIVGRFGPD